MLSTLCKDERVRERAEIQDGGVSSILDKMFLGRMVRSEQGIHPLLLDLPDRVKNAVELFRAHLKPHQNALVGKSGQTVLDRAVMEHNLLAASDLYNSINFTELGTLLCVSGERAEQVASVMICEGRLRGHIDQIARLVYFDQSQVLHSWDAKIGRLCHAVDGVVEGIRAKCPDWLAASFPDISL